MTQVLIIGYVWPEPNSSAAGSHMLSLIRLFLAQGWQVTFASPAQCSEHMVDLETLGVPAVNIPLNDSAFDSFARELNPDIVLFDRFMMEEQFGWRIEQQCPNALRLLDTEDFHSLRQARHQAHKAGRDVTDADLAGEHARREIAAIYRCDLTLMISDAEINLLTEHYRVPPALLHHCPFMLDLADLDQPRPGFDERQDFISIGNFRHAPNWDAVLWLKQEIWPLIRKQLPDAQLRVYGAYPPPKATALHNARQGFHVEGWAPDAFEVMRNARICLAPLRFGAGIKGKLADAMRCHTPSITTDIGAEGMTIDSEWCGSVHNSAQTIADAAVALYRDPAAWQRGVDKGRQILHRRFDRHAVGESLLARISQCRETLEAHRLANFTGLMLRHHSHRSTQFMSQWIESKNKLQAVLESQDTTLNDA